MLPIIQIKKGQEIRIVKGHPWIYSNEIENFSSLKNLEKGSLAKVAISKYPNFAIAYFNPHSLIAARILSYDTSQEINQKFFINRILAAQKLREKFYDRPFYRLIHSEADFLPGLIVDRFDKVFSCQISTAGMEKLSPFLLEALKEIFPNPTVIFKNEIETRKFEGLEMKVEEVMGIVPDEVEIEENNLKFSLNLKTGQKTGWFFDQRKNRQFLGSISKDCDVLDAFCYLGGFGINALKNQAKSVTFIDSSADALQLLQKNIDKNNLTGKTEIISGKVYDVLENADFRNRKFDIVNLDPPAFIKSKKDFFTGLKGYEKLIRLAENLVRKNGILILSSCSHHANVNDLVAAANDGFRKVGRKARLIRTFGADIDHPVHPALRESEYLKSITFHLE